jgi:hypothetical protein
MWDIGGFQAKENEELKARIEKLNSEINNGVTEREILLNICQDQKHIINCQQNRIDFIEDKFYQIYAQAESIGKEGSDFFAHYIANHDDIDWSTKGERGDGEISFPLKQHKEKF